MKEKALVGAIEGGFITLDIMKVIVWGETIELATKFEIVKVFIMVLIVTGGADKTPVPIAIHWEIIGSMIYEGKDIYKNPDGSMVS